jgi:facilitated trehalose transporter
MHSNANIYIINDSFFFFLFPLFSHHHSAISVGFVQLLASLLSGLLIDTIGRIPLLITSSVFMSLALASFGSYYHYEQHNGPSNNDWIPLLCVLIFTIAFSLGKFYTSHSTRVIQFCKMFF